MPRFDQAASAVTVTINAAVTTWDYGDHPLNFPSEDAIFVGVKVRASP
jgi:hypothetical protein